MPYLQHYNILLLPEELAVRDQREGAQRRDGAKEHADTNGARQRAKKTAWRSMPRGVVPLVSIF